MHFCQYQLLHLTPFVTPLLASIVTINAEELGAPLVNSAPTTLSSMISSFSCYCTNTLTAYQNPYILWILVSCLYYCNSKKNSISLSQVLSGPSLPRGPSSPTFTVHVLERSQERIIIAVLNNKANIKSFGRDFNYKSIIYYISVRKLSY